MSYYASGSLHSENPGGTRQDKPAAQGELISGEYGTQVYIVFGTPGTLICWYTKANSKKGAGRAMKPPSQ